MKVMKLLLGAALIVYPIAGILLVRWIVSAADAGWPGAAITLMLSGALGVMPCLLAAAFVGAMNK